MLHSINPSNFIRGEFPRTLHAGTEQSLALIGVDMSDWMETDKKLIESNKGGIARVSASRTFQRQNSMLKNEKPIDHDRIIFQALVNEGKHVKILNSRRVPVSFSEKDLRDAAHAEVANCTGGDAANYDDAADAKASRKRKHLDEDEKARASKDRNREHAKNTRLRKKAYIVKLSELAEKLRKQKDTEEEERVTLGEKIYETQRIRKGAVRLLLAYRACNMLDRENWAAILDENVQFTLPITPYRSFHKGDIKSSSRVLVGIDAFMSDTASLFLMAESIGRGSAMWKDAIKKGQACRVNYVSSNEDLISAGDLVMCRYLMKLQGSDGVGCSGSCVQHGMVQCRFNKLNKIESCEMIFDVMGFMQQLQRASGISPENSIVPNALHMAMQPTKDAKAIVKALPPYPVMHVNEAWTDLTGQSQSESEGQVLIQVLRAYDFQNDLIFRLASDCKCGRPGSTIYMSYDWRRVKGKGAETADASGTSGGFAGTPLVIYLQLLPLTSDSMTITHFVASIVDIPLTAQEAQSLVTSRMHSTPALNTPSSTAAATATGSYGTSRFKASATTANVQPQEASAQMIPSYPMNTQYTLPMQSTQQYQDLFHARQAAAQFGMQMRYPSQGNSQSFGGAVSSITSSGTGSNDASTNAEKTSTAQNTSNSYNTLTGGQQQQQQQQSYGAALGGMRMQSAPFFNPGSSAMGPTMLPYAAPYQQQQAQPILPMWQHYPFSGYGFPGAAPAANYIGNSFNNDSANSAGATGDSGNYMYGAAAVAPYQQSGNINAATCPSYPFLYNINSSNGNGASSSSNIRIEK